MPWNGALHDVAEVTRSASFNQHNHQRVHYGIVDHFGSAAGTHGAKVVNARRYGIENLPGYRIANMGREFPIERHP